MKNVRITFLMSAILFLLISCAGTGGGLGSISKSNELRPNMSTKEVESLLGLRDAPKIISFLSYCNGNPLFKR